LLAGIQMAYSFNLVTDIEQQTTFPIGQAASGTMLVGGLIYRGIKEYLRRNQ